MRFCRRIAVLFLVVASITSCSSRTTVTGTPPGVSSQQVADWDKAVNNLKTAQDHTIAARKVATTLNDTCHATPVVLCIFPDAQYGVALQAFGRANQIELEWGQFLQTVPNSWGQDVKGKSQAYAKQVLSQLTTANTQGVLGIKNPDSQKKFSDAIKLISNVITIILTLAGGVV